MTPEGGACVPLVDDDGLVVAHVLVSPDLDERGRRALLEVVAAAQRLMAEQDAADPEAAAERGSQGEYERVAELPECQNCVRRGLR